MKPRLIYISQFRDACGYAVAARGYLRALEKHLDNNPTVIPKTDEPLGTRDDYKKDSASNYGRARSNKLF